MTEPLSAGAADLLGQCVEVNVRSLARTTDLVIEGKDAELASLGQAFADLYDALDQLPDTVRTVFIVKLLARHGWARQQAERYINPSVE